MQVQVRKHSKLLTRYEARKRRLRARRSKLKREHKKPKVSSSVV